MLDKIRPTIDWYRWILKFHPVKYLGIGIMLIGPLIAIFRMIFLDSSVLETILISSACLAAGAAVWRIGWDPYN